MVARSRPSHPLIPAFCICEWRGKVTRTPRLSARARHYLQLGVHPPAFLSGAQSGGFTYWGRGEGDVALTAYAVRFLRDASKYITVDNAVTERARYLASPASSA